MILIFAVLCCGCAPEEYNLHYDKDSSKSAFRFESQDARECAAPFAANLCIPDEESTSANEVESGPDSYAAAMLFDIKGKKVIYNRHPYRMLYPASMTKVLTAVVAMENCDMDKVLTADESCVMTANDVQKVGLKEGDTMTLDQALHILLIYSANDVANLIAVNVAGSVEGFADMMNAKANAILIWASWNYESINVLNRLQSLRQHFDNRVKVLCVSLDANAKDSRRILKRDSIQWTAVCDGRMWESPVIQKTGLSHIPDNIVFDSQGKVVAHSLNLDDLLKTLEELIE